MMKVTKKELVERTFIPYEIKIEINSADDHKRLVNDFQRLYRDERSFWRTYNLYGEKSVVEELASVILNHRE